MEQTRQLWPGWDIDPEPLGHGSFGSVYRITRTNLGIMEEAALKVISIPKDQSDIQELKINGYTKEGLTTHFRSYLDSIIREYSLMSALKGHRNIVYCDDLKSIQHDDGIGWNIYIKMELLTPLIKAIPETYEEGWLIRLGMDMCRALILCAGEKIVHRDIKPQNIFVSRDGDFKLGDFGIAKVAEATAVGTKAGTYSYMAPEVYKGEAYGAAADIYSLGLVLYWVMNRRQLPFLPKVPGADAMEMARLRRLSGETIPDPADGSPELKRIIRKACAYHTRDRYRSAQDMLQDLQVLGGGRQMLTDEEKTLLEKEEARRQEAEEMTRLQEDARRKQEAENQRRLEEILRRQDEELRRQEAENRRLREEKQRETEARLRWEAEEARRKQKEAERKRRNLAIAAGILVIAVLAGLVGAKLGSDSKEPTVPPTEAQAVSDPAPESPVATIPETTAASRPVESVPETTLPPETTIPAPLEIPFENRIAAGNYHSAYLRSDGTVCAVGSTEKSQYSNRGTRIDTESWRNIVAVSAASHTVGLRSDGTVVAVGIDKFGQCNVDGWRDIVAIDAGDNHTVGLRSDGTVVAVGDNGSGQCDVSGWRNIVAVAASEKTTYGLTEDGRVVSAGSKNYGRTWTDIVAISAGPYHVVGLKSDGTIVQTGICDQWDHQGKNWYNIVAVSAGVTHTVGLCADGTVVACGGSTGDKGQSEVASWNDIVAISAGLYHTLGLKEDGTVVSVGNNAYGQRDITG